VRHLLRPAKYPERFARKYLQRCPQPRARLRRHVCLYLDNELCLDLSNKLHTELNRKKFEKLFQQLFRTLFASLFGSLFVLKYPQLWGLTYLALCRQRLPTRQSLGRPLPDRIVAGHRRTTTYR
jgi:hypothetical protein